MYQAFIVWDINHGANGGSMSDRSWFKTDFTGIRYRKHPTRKHGVQADRYYAMFYKVDGKTISEGMGWASEGVKPSECYQTFLELKRNRKNGTGPRTLSEKRAIADAERLEQERIWRAEKNANVSFKTFFEDTFLPDAKSRWTSETTRKAVEHVINWIHPVTGDIPFRELGLQHINRIRANIANAGRTPRMQQYVARTFAMVWRSAQDFGIVDVACPTKSASFRLPRVDNERQRYLTVEEEVMLLEKVKKRSPQAHDMAVVSLDAGLRFNEVASLNWQCVDLEAAMLRILDTKGGRDRTVPMTNRLKALFASMERGKPSGLVFPNTKGIKHLQVPSAFKRGLADAKLNEAVTNPKLRASFHSLRHTAASRLVQAGVDLYLVQRILGNSVPTTTTRYSHLANDNLNNAIQAMERGKQKSNGRIIPLRKKACAR